MLSLIGKRIEELGHFWIFTSSVLTNWMTYPNQGSSSEMRGRIWRQMFEIGFKSIPVIMITGGFVGMTLALAGYMQFKSVGLESRLGSIINISVVKEMGPVLAAVMLAGRVGGALTAELGTMKVTEQIDALKAMGSDPITLLVLPRFIACILLMPFLIIYADLMGILGGYIISVLHFGISSDAYWRYSASTIENWDIFIGIGKGLLFGASIALISCYKGFHCKNGAYGVGQACTQAFVKSFIMILLIDFVMVIVFQNLYITFWTLKSIL